MYIFMTTLKKTFNYFYSIRLKNVPRHITNCKWYMIIKSLNDKFLNLKKNQKEIDICGCCSKIAVLKISTPVHLGCLSTFC